ncbi:SoxR reducing system RseC family protein [Arhodomonas sp. AD133]|uniref:SoxR reducing system RseC family protein n=1 Tax=Arhodomonas sp. AD133 TaxID=3415009 RepID=UPI003EBC264D
MITERGEVVAVEPGVLWVQTTPTATCDGCAVRSGCGTGALSSFLARGRRPLRIACDVPARVGDAVVLGIRERLLLTGSMVVYLLPLLWLLTGAMVGHILADRLGGPPDAGAVPGGLLALVAWWVVIGRLPARAPTVHVLEVLAPTEERG